LGFNPGSVGYPPGGAPFGDPQYPYGGPPFHPHGVLPQPSLRVPLFVFPPRPVSAQCGGFPCWGHIFSPRKHSQIEIWRECFSLQEGEMG
jgi:hypothetical protein